MMLKIVCTDCHTEAHPLDWRCKVCGGVLDFPELPPFSADQINMADTTLWRYADWIPLERKITLGEGMTPLVETEIDGRKLLAKLEYLNPTGSYKDRGTTTLMNHIAAFEVDEVIDDSSGNAGASIAAYASALGIPARIFVPESGSPAKKALIQAFGGTLEEIAGAQYLKTEACHKAAETTTYASHAWSPFFLLGQITAGFEIWEQTRPNIPDAIVVPVGHGALFVGIARGFALLKQAGLVNVVPKMIAVNSELSDPIVQGFETDAEVPPVVRPEKRTIADGIIVDKPVNGKEILRTLKTTNGAAFRVNDEQIQAAQTALAKRGLIAEPTSAASVAALPQVEALIGTGKRIVCCLTGNGLKNVGR